MAIIEYRTSVSHKYYMRKSKDEIVTRIDMMRAQLKLEPIDKLKILQWDKWNLAHEALKTHDLFPPESEGNE